MQGILGSFIFSNFILGNILASPPSSLRLVSLLYRHGDRSPVKIYPKDIHQEYNTWPDGLGWLTNLGKQQQYELGEFLKDRYDGFLNTSYYNHEEIRVESSAENRCLMSAYSNLAGLYPPLAAQLWNPDLKWQPIPVQSKPLETDNKLGLKQPCPRYDQLFAELLNSTAVREEQESYEEFFKMVEKNTGIKRESLKDFWSVADTLTCEKAHNLTWNDWVYAPDVWETILELQTIAFDLLFNTSAMVRLKGGPLLKEIIANMEAASETLNPLPKVYMYSAHDTTVAALLRAMLIFNTPPPEYRALVIVELHEIDSKHVVKILYRNDSTTEPYEFIPKGCSDPCTLQEFIKVTAERVPGNWQEECKVKVKPSNSGSDSLSPASWLALGVAVGLCITLVAVVTVLVVRLRCRRDSNVAYSRI
ncbi:lysosomal acid phosphatase [Plakobranchus ocellatus]|uniref:acid phosphatase n=1 Tax=Plakobranchus ocellatus TaxID=259542 RepID=A0AAV4C346_9GAST|nr:lysosomal acid phosphatase [Plakobranchus ocellatus]